MESSPTAKRLIFASSMTVAGQDQHRRVPPLRVDEPPQPGDVYGRSTAECERRIQDSKLEWTILRLPVCSPAALSNKASAGFHHLFDTSARVPTQLGHTADAGMPVAHAH